MGDDDKGLSELVTKREKELMKAFGRGGVQISTGLIRKDDIRFIDQGASDGNALLLSPREFVRFVVDAFGKSQK